MGWDKDKSGGEDYQRGGLSMAYIQRRLELSIDDPQGGTVAWCGSWRFIAEDSQPLLVETGDGGVTSGRPLSQCLSWIT